MDLYDDIILGLFFNQKVSLAFVWLSNRLF